MIVSRRRMTTSIGPPMAYGAMQPRMTTSIGPPMAYGQLGTIGCGAFDTLIGRLETLLTQAEGLNLQSSAAYINGKTYDTNNAGFFNTAVIVGSACDSAVAELNSIIANLQTAIAGVGAAPVVPTSSPAQTAGTSADPNATLDPLTQITDTTKWIVGGAIAVAAAVIVWKVVGLIGVARKLKGPYRAWDPEQRDLEAWDPEERDLQGYRRKRRRSRR